MSTSRWTDEFLDRMRLEGDTRADEMLALLIADGEADRAWRTQLFRQMDSNDAKPIEATFPVLAGFFRATEGLPADVDVPRITRGEAVFERYAYDGGMVLLTKSLPEGYQAPPLGTILAMSGDLLAHTYRRLLATLQTVVNVAVYDGFKPGGRAVINAQKLRLLHAGVRHVTREALPEYEKTYGVPVNAEDLLATIMGFSLLVIEGWETLGLPLSRDEQEDYLYLWLTFGRMMGIYPGDDHESLAYIPADLDDARAFYTAYERRHYVDAERNPVGVELARANLAMLQNLVPRLLRPLGFGLVPRILMHELMGAPACERLGIAPVPGHTILKAALGGLHKLLTLFERGSERGYERLSMVLMQSLIGRAYGGRVAFTLPTQMARLREMVYQQGVPDR